MSLPGRPSAVRFQPLDFVPVRFRLAWFVLFWLSSVRLRRLGCLVRTARLCSARLVSARVGLARPGSSWFSLARFGAVASAISSPSVLTALVMSLPGRPSAVRFQPLDVAPVRFRWLSSARLHRRGYLVSARRDFARLGSARPPPPGSFQSTPPFVLYVIYSVGRSCRASLTRAHRPPSRFLSLPVASAPRSPPHLARIPLSGPFVPPPPLPCHPLAPHPPPPAAAGQFSSVHVQTLEVIRRVAAVSSNLAPSNSIARAPSPRVPLDPPAAPPTASASMLLIAVVAAAISDAGVMADRRERPRD